jgi:hypothetical protein
VEAPVKLDFEELDKSMCRVGASWMEELEIILEN